MRSCMEAFGMMYVPMFKKHVSAELLFAEAEARGFHPSWETGCGLFSLVHKKKTVFIYYTKLHCNSQLGSQMCGDKHLARTFLARENFPNIPYCYSNQKAEINRFFDQHTPLIQKPLLGMKAQNVRLISHREEICFENLEDTFFEKYIEGTEYRVLIVQKAIAMQKKILKPTEKYPWRKHVTNIPRHEWLPELVSMAESLAQKLHMTCMAVDYIVNTANQVFVLELNSMPGLYSFHHPDTGEPVNIASELLTVILHTEEHGALSWRKLEPSSLLEL